MVLRSIVNSEPLPWPNQNQKPDILKMFEMSPGIAQPILAFSRIQKLTTGPFCSLDNLSDDIIA